MISRVRGTNFTFMDRIQKDADSRTPRITRE